MSDDKKTEEKAETPEAAPAESAASAPEKKGGGMLKKLIIVVAVIAVLGIIGTVILAANIGPIIKAGIETVGPKITNTSVTVEAVEVSPTSGAGEIRGLVIGNPEGYKTDSIFRFDRVALKIDLASLKTDKIIIEEINIDAPAVTYEVGLGNSNVGTLKKRLEALVAGTAEDAPSDEEAGGPGKKLQINNFIVTNGSISVSAKLAGGKKLTLPLTDIHVKDIGGGGEGATVVEAVTVCVKELVDVTSGVVSKSKELMSDVTEGGKAVLDAGKSVTDGLKNVFKKKDD
jgi:hypothetical protein